MWEIWDGDEYVDTVFSASDADRYSEAGYIVIYVRNC